MGNQLFAHPFSLSTLTLAANETTSRTLCRILHILSERPEVQERLRAELIEARLAHGDLDYDQLGALPFLDAIVRETFRV